MRTFFLAMFLLLSNVASASLISVGQNVVYDSDLGVSFAKDWNLFHSQAQAAVNSDDFVKEVIQSVGGVVYDTIHIPQNGGYILSKSDFNTFTGQMTWWGAKAWVVYLNQIGYGGITEWRLPTLSPVNGVSFDYRVTLDGSSDHGFNTTAVNQFASELANLYYQSLGNVGYYSPSGEYQPSYGMGIPNGNAGPFMNIQPSIYWLGLETDIDPNNSWVFRADGGQFYQPKGAKEGWTVPMAGMSPVVTVSEPETLALIGVALLGFVGARRNVGKN